jgi:hypothetical protein
MGGQFKADAASPEEMAHGWTNRSLFPIFFFPQISL